MPVLTASEADRPLLRAAMPGTARMLVVGLCAQWCGTCREFRAAFEALAKRWPQVTWVWLDVEDDSELAGDIDIENFPTLAVFRSGQPVHFGVSLPQSGVIDRLLTALSDDLPRAITVPDEVVRLPELLARHADQGAAAN